MININDLTIGQAKELATMFGDTPAPSPHENRMEHGWVIAVLDRGFVYVGYVVTDREWCHITDAWNVRVWGTELGLGQLVAGPTSKTKLDRVGNVRVPMHALQHMIVGLSYEGWSSWMNKSS